MNRKISIMAASLLIVAAMPQAEANEPEVIGRPDIQVVDGKLTPEMMEAFGRVSGPQVSPDGKSVLYSVEFVNLKADKGNRESEYRSEDTFGKVHVKSGKTAT